MHAITILLGYATVVAGRGWSVEDYPPDRRPPRLARPASAADYRPTPPALISHEATLRANYKSVSS